jgi:hypothetical protein
MRRFCGGRRNLACGKSARLAAVPVATGPEVEYGFPDMAPLFDRLSQNLSGTSLAAVAEMAVGVGAGLLVADQLGKDARQRLGLVALIAGLAATIPLLIGAGVRVNRELGEGRRTRRRLETIRHDPGVPDDGDFY